MTNEVISPSRLSDADTPDSMYSLPACIVKSLTPTMLITGIVVSVTITNLFAVFAEFPSESATS